MKNFFKLAKTDGLNKHWAWHTIRKQHQNKQDRDQSKTF